MNFELSRKCPNCKRIQPFDTIFGYQDILCPDLCTRQANKEVNVKKVKPCLVGNCGNPAKSLSYCYKHYKRFKKYGNCNIINVNGVCIDDTMPFDDY